MVRHAHLFVAVLGAARVEEYVTYACATWHCSLQPTGQGEIIAALALSDGVPRSLVPDQPRVAIADPNAYGPPRC